MGIIGGIIGVAVLLFLIFSIGAAKQTPTFGKLQRLCQQDSKRFERVAREMHCWNIVIGSIPPNPTAGWYEFIPSPGKSNIRYWLKFNGIQFPDEQNAFSALKDKLETSERMDTILSRRKSDPSLLNHPRPTMPPKVGAFISEPNGVRTENVSISCAPTVYRVVKVEGEEIFLQSANKSKIITFSEYASGVEGHRYTLID